MYINNDKGDELEDNIRAMLDKECSTYRCSLFTSVSMVERTHASEIRRKMVNWSYKFVNYGEFSKETVALAFSNLDRFLHTNQGRFVVCDEKIFQLATISSLSIAIKILESTVLNLNNMVYLSNGTFSLQDIIQMEKMILSSLMWRLNPPTSFSFIELFIELLQRKYAVILGEQFKNQTLLQAEVAVSDLEFCQVKPSIIAVCSILNSIQSFHLLADVQQMFSELIIDFDSLDEGLHHVRTRLVYLHGANFDSSNCADKQTTNEDERITHPCGYN